MIWHYVQKPLIPAVVLAVIVASLVGGAPSSPAAASEDSAREVVSLRTENSATYQLGNGQMRTDVYAADIFYEDQVGDLVPIDNSLVELPDGGSYRYTNKANSWHVYFANNPGATDAIKLEKGEYSLCTWLIGADASCRATRLTSVSGPKSGPWSEFAEGLAQDNRTLVYEAALPSVDLAYTVRSEVLKETIILRERSKSSEFTFALKLANLTPETRDGRTVFVDENGGYVFGILPMYMEDAEGKYSGAVTYTVETQGVDEYRLVVSVDSAFLDAPDTVYPVRIDPTYDTKGSSYTFDTYVSSYYSSQNFGGSGYLCTGYDDEYKKQRTYIRFRLPSGYYAGDGISTGILSASLKLTARPDTVGSRAIRAYAVCDAMEGGFWKSSELDWSPQPTLSSIVSPYATRAGNVFTMDVTTAIRYNYLEFHSNLGFCVKDDNESTSSSNANYYSSDSGVTSCLPVLSITHTGTTYYYYYSGHWATGLADDLTVYVYDDADAVCGSGDINAACVRWNGINSGFNVDSISHGEYSDDFTVYMSTDDQLDDWEYACTANFTAEEEVDWSGTWVQSWVFVNPNAESGVPGAHSDLQQELMGHELGHTAGLRDVGWDQGLSINSVCLMQGYGFYCYPYPTSHDKQTLNAKY